MTAEEVQECLAISKVYIDFGFHPGKDRLPREAALSGCVVITGRRGAAANNIDVNIDDEFKFDEYNCKIDDILNKIREVFSNFTKLYKKQEGYRERIKDDKRRFANEVASAFGVRKIVKHACICCNENEYDNVIKNLKKANKDIIPTYVLNRDEIEKRVSGDFSIYKMYNNSFISTKEKVDLELVSYEDARFLYQEGRISVFVFSSSIDKENVQEISRRVGLS